MNIITFHLEEVTITFFVRVIYWWWTASIFACWEISWPLLQFWRTSLLCGLLLFGSFFSLCAMNISHCFLLDCQVLVAQLCLTLCDPMDCSPQGFSLHGIFQARILECVSTSFSKGSSWFRDRTLIFSTACSFFTIWATRESFY